MYMYVYMYIYIYIYIYFDVANTFIAHSVTDVPQPQWAKQTVACYGLLW